MIQLAEFNSQKEAADILKINNKYINNCCRGKCKTTHGFIFKYKL
jgi:plasmid maintenance system antidote protein VapI